MLVSLWATSGAEWCTDTSLRAPWWKRESWSFSLRDLWLWVTSTSKACLEATPSHLYPRFLYIWLQKILPSILIQQQRTQCGHFCWTRISPRNIQQKVRSTTPGICYCTKKESNSIEKQAELNSKFLVKIQEHYWIALCWSLEWLSQIILWWTQFQKKIKL